MGCLDLQNIWTSEHLNIRTSEHIRTCLCAPDVGCLDLQNIWTSEHTRTCLSEPDMGCLDLLSYHSVGRALSALTEWQQWWSDLYRGREGGLTPRIEFRIQMLFYQMLSQWQQCIAMMVRFKHGERGAPPEGGLTLRIELLMVNALTEWQQWWSDL